MSRFILFTINFLAITTLNFSCTSMKSIRLKKGKTTFREAQMAYNNKNEINIFKFHKELTNYNGAKFTVHIL